MAKLATFAALLLLAMVGLASCTTYTTITTTTITKEVTNPSGSGTGDGKKCREQITGQEISHCWTFLRCERGSPYQESLRMVVNPAETSPCAKKLKRMCCDELRNVKDECRCKSIDKMMGTHKQEMLLQARDLINRCKLGYGTCSELQL